MALYGIFVTLVDFRTVLGDVLLDLEEISLVYAHGVDLAREIDGLYFTGHAAVQLSVGLETLIASHVKLVAFLLN